jgi:hypothetical protein
MCCGCWSGRTLGTSRPSLRVHNHLQLWCFRGLFFLFHPMEARIIHGSSICRTSFGRHHEGSQQSVVPTCLNRSTGRFWLRTVSQIAITATVSGSWRLCLNCRTLVQNLFHTYFYSLVMFDGWFSTVCVHRSYSVFLQIASMVAWTAMSICETSRWREKWDHMGRIKEEW